MEHLNKTQIVLLCLLVSFITSIGTGIITASLLQEAPQNVTQTINRVVERTVETIVPQPTGVTTREVTVVVKEEDLVIGAIGKNRESLVRLVESGSQPVTRSLGVIIRNDGLIMADKGLILPNTVYSIVFSDGESYQAEIIHRSEETDVVFVKPVIRSSDARVFKPVSVGNSDALQLGQTVIALGGREKESVSIGRVISLGQVEPPAADVTTGTVLNIETDAPVRDSIPGSILLNLNGDLVGFEDFDSGSQTENFYSGINIIRRANSSLFGASAN